jgi:indole-3-glycerol phosphate synthase
MADLLERILARKRAEVEAARAAVPLSEMRERSKNALPVRDFVS